MKRKYDFTWDRLECYGTRELIEIILEIQEKYNELEEYYTDLESNYNHLQYQIKD